MFDGRYSFIVSFSLVLTIIFCLSIGIASAETYCVDDSPSSIDGIACNSSINEAVGAANHGDTVIVRDGTYTENVDVEKRLTIVSENGSDNCIVRGRSSNTVFYVTSDHVNISDLTIKDAKDGYEYGVHLYGANYCNISNNNITKNDIGIRLESSSNNNVILNNEISDSDRFGIYIVPNSYYNTFTDNKVNGDYYYHYVNETGLVIENLALDAPRVSNVGKVTLINCSEMVLRNLSLTNNKYGNQYGHGLYLYETDGCSVEELNASNNIYGISLINSNHNTILNAKNSRNPHSGINLEASSNNVFKNITITKNGAFGGIYAETYSVDNSIKDCNITDNQGPGIWIYYNCDNTTIKNCNVSANGEYSYQGISIFSENNTITGNIVNSNTLSGIAFASKNNIVEDNIVKGNGFCGIEASYNGHIIRNNTVSMNSDYGLYLWGTGSSIYNNIFNNTKNFYVSSSYSNTWNTTNTTGTNIIGGNRLGGNAWFWPNGTGHSQGCADDNGDSFCDNPYELNANNTDYLPLALTGIDSIPPSVSIISPQNTTYLASTIYINVTATDASGISEVKAQIDGTNITLNYENGYYVNSTSLSDGNHWVRIFAEDTAGNTNSDEIVYFSTTTAVSNCSVISYPGYYHLTNNITNSSSPKCITINSSDVVFDAHNFFIDGLDTHGTYGVYVSDNSLDNVTVMNVTATDWYHGIHYQNTHNGLIENNYLQDNRYGIYLDDSANNTLRNNQMTDNTYNFDIDADDSTGFYNHIDTTNLVQGRSIYYLFSVSDLLIDSSSNAGLVYCINSQNITVRDSTFSHNSKSIYFLNTTDSRVENNVFTHNDYGIYLDSSINNNITSNNATENNYGYYLYNSTDNLVDSNTALDNGKGIKLFHQCSHNTIIRNNCAQNGLGIGIGQYEGDYTCYNNTVYLNHLIENGENGHDPSFSNHWNSTSLVSYEYNGTTFSNYTGNYWGDYTGLDNNSDGIGDTPYDIYGGPGESSAKDYYPMILTFEEAPVITNIQQGTPTNNSVTISWQTNMGSNNRILYSVNQNLSSGLWSEWHNNTLNPEITLTDLQGNSTYYYRVYSYNRDNSNLYSNSSVYNFTTIRDNVVWIVDDDGLDCEANFSKIQDAVNASIDGDTIIVCNGTYKENVLVNKSLNITGLDRPHLNANKTGSGFTLTEAGSIIQGFLITNSTYSGSNFYGTAAGVRIGWTSYSYYGGAYHRAHHGCSNNIVRENIFLNNSYGVLMVLNSNGNTISGNEFNDGVTIWNAKYNTIADNNFTTRRSIPIIVGYDSVLPYDIPLYNRIENNTFNRTLTYPSPFIRIDNGFDHNVISGNTMTGYGGITVNSDNNRIDNNTIIGGEGLPHPLDIGIRLRYANNCIVNNNTIEMKYKGIYIETSSSYISTTNLTMKNNRMANNSYHFYIYPPPTVSTNAPSFGDFNHHIDPSNTIVVEGEEKKIYYLVNISNDIIDYDDAGFVACINCQNVTIRSLSLQDNSHGILLYNNTNVTVDNVYTHDNHIAGISAYDSTNITIRDSWIMNNGDEDSESMGINFGNTANSKVENCLIETNWCEGIRLDHSHENTVSHSNITDNGPSYDLSPIYEACDRGSGIRFIEADENTVHSNYILATTIPTHYDWTGGQTYGIYMFGAHSNNNTVYNNYFNSSGNAYDRRHDSAQDGGHNFWNITRTPGTNIIGGSYLGGNYWHDYAGADTEGEDGLGDTQIPYNSSGDIINGGDYHPLTALGNDTTPPSISIIAPVEGKSYGANYVHLKVHSLDNDVHSWWYSLDNKSNVSFKPNTTITGLSNGQHSVVVYVNDTAGNVNSDMVNFTISVSTGGSSGGGGGSGFTVQEPLEEVEEEELEFDITITSPKDKRYTDREIALSYTSSVPLERASYIIDGSDPVSINPSSSITIKGLTLGEHNLLLNGEEYYGMKGRGEVSFEVVPLALGEVDSAGTPEFPEDVAFSFMGRSVDHKLTLEADVNGKVDVYINKFLKEDKGNKTVENYTDSGMFIGSMNTSGWTTYEFNMSADALVPDGQNILSFIHVNNSQGKDTEEWRIKNLNLMPLMDTQAPQIEVFTLDKSIAEGEELEFYVKIDGITNESSFDAYIYLLGPDGTIRYYPDWGEQQTLDAYYLKNNHYGRLPDSIEFEGFAPGTYAMVGKIVEKGDTHPIALSTEKIYYNPHVSTRIYVDQVFTDGEEVIIEHALTPGTESHNGTVFISLEDPDHNRLYLPAMSESIWGKDYIPLASEFSTVFTGKIGSSWKNGTYVVRSDVYSDEGDLLAEDMQTFDICRESGKLSGRYIFGSFSSIYLSQIQLIDAKTLEIIDKEIEGGHSSYSINAPPGDYYLVGKAYGGDGRVFNIPFTPIALKCGEEVRRNIILRDTGVTLSEQEMEDMGLSMSSYDYGSIGQSNSLTSSLNSISFQENQDSCSKPKVYLMVGPPWNISQVDQELVTKYQRMIKQSSTNVMIYSYSDVRNVLAEQEQLLVENPGAEVDFSAAGKMVNADYILSFSHSTLGSKYVMTSTLLDVDRVQAVQRASTSGSNKDSVLSTLIFSQGDVGATIRAWEMNKLPPRDPIISLTLDPDTVTLEEGKNEANIKVRVVDCKGNPVEGARVYFDHITDRGYVKAEGGAEHYSSYVYSTTDGDGNAEATYVLHKGSKAGKDTVDIFVKARGNKKVHQKAVIKIAGIGIEIAPEEEEVSPGEDTLIHISLYSENEKGERKPLEGKMILVQTFVRTDSKIEPMGPTFEGTDNPVTDQNGEATLKFIAGKKEGVVKIRAMYQGLSYEDSVFDDTWIEVKKEEFIISINWEEYYNYYSDSTYGRYGTKFGVVYGYDFDSKTIWDRRSDRETTDASITFKQKTNRIDKSIYCNCMCAEWNGRECEKPVPYCLKETTTGSSDTSITPKMSNVKTVHTKLREDNAGNLWVYINPVKVKVPLSGSLDGEWQNFWIKEADYNCVCTGFGMVCSYPRGEEGPDWTLVDSESTDGTVNIDYSGKNYYPDPKYFANCIMVKGSDSRRYADCNYYWGEDFPDGYIKLRKIGENTYGAYHYFWKDKDEIEESLFIGRQNYNYEIHRTFDVTVVRR